MPIIDVSNEELSAIILLIECDIVNKKQFYELRSKLGYGDEMFPYDKKRIPRDEAILEKLKKIRGD